MNPQPFPGEALTRLRAGASPAQREAIEAIVTRFAVHRRQRFDRRGQIRDYLELCVSYVMTMVDYSRETVRRAWSSVRSVMGWKEIGFRDVLERGLKLREKSGAYWGRHCTIPASWTESLRSLLDEWGIRPKATRPVEGWVKVDQVRKGRGLVCCCPFHEDSNPSMLLDPKTGVATCLAGCGPMLFDGERGAVHSSHRASQGGCTIEYPDRPAAPHADYRALWLPRRARTWRVGSLDARGLRRTSEPGDLLACMWRSHLVHGTSFHGSMGEGCPDLLVSLDETAPQEWTKVGGRWRPSRERMVRAVRFVAVDVDGIEYSPAADAWRDAGRLEGFADGHALLSGRLSAVQTSDRGVQVVFELAAPRRGEWRRSRECATLHREIDREVMRFLRSIGYRGGKPDRTARKSGRWVRRPGPRVKRGRWMSADLLWLTGRGCCTQFEAWEAEDGEVADVRDGDDAGRGRHHQADRAHACA